MTNDSGTYRSKRVSAAGQLLLAGSGQGFASAGIILAVRSQLPREFTEELTTAAAFTAAAAAVVASAAISYLRRGFGGAGGAWVLVMFVLVVGACGLPLAAVNVARLASDVAEGDPAGIDVLIGSIPPWFMNTTTALAGGQLFMCLVAAILLSSPKARPHYAARRASGDPAWGERISGERTSEEKVSDEMISGERVSGEREALS
jgi:hypothetical protein